MTLAHHNSQAKALPSPRQPHPPKTTSHAHPLTTHPHMARTELGGRVLRSEAVASVLSRANLYYGIVRGLFCLFRSTASCVACFCSSTVCLPVGRTLMCTKMQNATRQGLRQTYYSIPLFAWLMGPWEMVAVTVLYLLFIVYVESVDTLMHHVRT